jgi:hypothetical protein
MKRRITDAVRDFACLPGASGVAEIWGRIVRNINHTSDGIPLSPLYYQQRHNVESIARTNVQPRLQG